MEERKKIIWSQSALQATSKALKWISQESIQGAEIIEATISQKLNQASINPFRFPPDKFKTDNKGDYRCFAAHHFLISYKIVETEIRILRVRHTKRNPKTY